MDDNERGPWRKLLLGVVLIALAAGAVVVLARAGGERSPEVAAPVTQAPLQAPAPAPSRPVINAPSLPGDGAIGRAGLLDAAASAASAYTAGAEPSAAATALNGRRFALSIPFGCEGPQEPGARFATWAVGPAGQTLRITAKPELWTQSPFAQTLGGGEAESVEGFWIPRPWQLTEGCPGRPVDPLAAEAPPPSPQTVGLATVYGPGSSRLGRRGDRAYELTLPLAEVGRPGPQGLQLVLEGRVTPFKNQGIVACRAASPEQRPVCLIGAVLERVAIRNPANGRVLGEWREAPVTTPDLPRPSEPQGSGAAAQ